MAYPLDEYRQLLTNLALKGYHFSPVCGFFEEGISAWEMRIFLRHDVDRKPWRALAMAQVEQALGIQATYYFRCTQSSRFPAAYIRQIAALGHEIGFHYEAVVRTHGDKDAAFQQFFRELSALRALAEVKTVSAHGSPLSSFSNMGYTRTLDLAHLGILGDASEDLDFSRVIYITDTGGKFGSALNLRDKIQGMAWTKPANPQELAGGLNPTRYPFVLLNCHPERWPQSSGDLLLEQAQELAVNLVKLVLIWWRKS